jgi:chaperone modulatory protein CbpM
MELLMLSIDELAVRASVETETILAWVEEGWLMPWTEDPLLVFSEIDLARAQLILNLKHDLGVNEEGIAVILDLLDQIHGLRSAVKKLSGGRPAD